MRTRQPCATRIPPRIIINMKEQPASTSDDPHRCMGGPLDGEWHSQGSRFKFDGRSIGAKSGWYVLEGTVYVWIPAPDTVSG